MTSTNASSIALAERYAREHFGLSLPFTAEQLKSAFRSMAKKLHTDTSGDNSTKELFIAMKDAYDFLAKLEGMEFVYSASGESEGSVRLVTIDGTPLYELGLGLGAMKNGRDCERCDHKGYTVEEDHNDYFRGGYCTRCDSHGRIHGAAPCGSCASTGRFRQHRSGKLVMCRACAGSGVKFMSQICPYCDGRKNVGKTKSRTRYAKCYECAGTGEIELFSPLLPKGRLVNSR